jgi:hypothetical protein
MVVTLAEKLKVLKRELAMRRALYPKWVKLGRMKPADAEHELAVMEAVTADYALLIDQAKDKGDLL